MRLKAKRLKGLTVSSSRTRSRAQDAEALGDDPAQVVGLEMLDDLGGKNAVQGGGGAVFQKLQGVGLAAIEAAGARLLQHGIGEVQPQGAAAAVPQQGQEFAAPAADIQDLAGGGEKGQVAGQPAGDLLAAAAEALFKIGVLDGRRAAP